MAPVARHQAVRSDPRCDSSRGTTTSSSLTACFAAVVPVPPVLLALSTAARFAKALLTGCKELVRIALHDNKIGDEGCAALADAFNKGAISQTGEFFYFQNNPFTDKGKEVLAKIV